MSETSTRAPHVMASARHANWPHGALRRRSAPSVTLAGNENDEIPHDLMVEEVPVPGLTEFAGEVERRFETADELRRREGSQLAEAMRPREEARRAFERVAEVVHAAIIQPRCEELTRRFEHATLTHLATREGLCTRCVFGRTERFPATAVLCVGVALQDDEGAGGALFYSVDLRPALIEYEREDRIALPHQATPWNDLAGWVEGKLLRFVESYLSTQCDPAYQRDNVHVDPVCGMPVPAAVALQSATHEGRTFYFCAPGCRERFVENPALYLKGPVRLPDAGERPGGDAAKAPRERPEDA